jgi:hypothetical protein
MELKITLLPFHQANLFRSQQVQGDPPRADDGRLRTYSTTFNMTGGEDCGSNETGGYLCNMRKGQTCKTIKLVMPWILCHILVKVDSGMSTAAEFASKYT